MKIKTLLSIVLALTGEYVIAAAPPSTLVVDAVQMPAWVEQASGARDALVVGRVLHNKERVVTGAGARAWLRLADGSLVKLGENGQLGLDDLGQPKFNGKNLVT